MTKEYGIIGYPLGHTLSPTLHNWGFGGLGIEARYDAYPLEPEKLPDFMQQVRQIPLSGLSVTIPHKQSVMPYLDRISPLAQAVGAVNTLYWDGDDLCGENTDVLGLMAPLKQFDSLPETAMVLGAGGAARAAIVGLKELGMSEIMISNRTHAKAQDLADEFGITHVIWEDRLDAAPGLICNTTPLGMAGELESATPWDGACYPDGCVAYDIVYNPLRTRFLQEAEAAGCRTISGLEMFLHQGLAQFRLWTGLEMDEQGARTMLLQALQG